MAEPTDTAMGSRARADAYLPPEPLLILHAASDGVEALVTDVRDTWRVRWTPAGGWACSCPARSTSCGHIGAVRMLIVIDRQPDPSPVDE